MARTGGKQCRTILVQPGIVLRTCCAPDSVLATLLSPPRSRSHVSEQTLAPFAIWELEDDPFLTVPCADLCVSVQS